MDEFKAHLQGFEERRKKTDKMHEENQASIATLQSDVTDIRSSQLRQEATYKKHADDDTAFQKKTEEAIQQLNVLLPIVKEQLLPAFKAEQETAVVMAWLKKRATSASFWLGVIASLGGFLYGLLWVIKQFLK